MEAQALIGVILIALLLDRWLGEPRRWHPLVGFGWLASALERRVNSPDSGGHFRLRGALCWVLLVLPVPLLLAWAQSTLFSTSAQWVTAVLCLYFCIGAQSLREHGLAVARMFQQRGLDAARQQVSRMVSRDTGSMNESAVARATIESVLENGSDAIFASLFWFAVLGPEAAIVHRLANTLDAMWGYRNRRFLQFGWFSARMDDLLNWIPAHLSALAYALLGSTARALSCWRQQAAHCASPNGGAVMCSGAGALDIVLGGGAHYHGQWQSRPLMGMGCDAQMSDVQRSVVLVDQTTWLWVVAIALLTLGVS